MNCIVNADSKTGQKAQKKCWEDWKEIEYVKNEDPFLETIVEMLRNYQLKNIILSIEKNVTFLHNTTYK